VEPALPTPTPTAPLPTATASTTLPTVATTADRAAYRLGYVDRGDHCGVVTEIVSLILTQNLGLEVESRAFPTSDDLFTTLANKDEAQRVDLTLCYMDPDDRPYLQKHLGFVLLVGGGYRKIDTKTYLILSNAAVKKVIQRDQPCIYTLLTELNLTAGDLAAQDARTWYDAHPDLVRSWTNCS
jgi:hypothetical protein